MGLQLPDRRFKSVSHLKKKHDEISHRVFLLLGQDSVELGSTNKSLAMRVVEDALAYSKKPPVI